MSDLEVGSTASYDFYWQFVDSLIANGSNEQVRLSEEQWEKACQLPTKVRMLMEIFVEPSVEIDGKLYDSRTAANLVGLYGDISDPKTKRFAQVFWNDGGDREHRPLKEQLKNKIPKKFMKEYDNILNTYNREQIEEYTGPFYSKRNNKFFWDLTGVLNNFKGKLERSGYKEAAKCVSKYISRASDSRLHHALTCMKAVLKY